MFFSALLEVTSSYFKLKLYSTAEFQRRKGQVFLTLLREGGFMMTPNKTVVYVEETCSIVTLIHSNTPIPTSATTPASLTDTHTQTETMIS